MGKIRKIDYNGKKVTLERVDADETREVARENKGSFNDDFGVYFVLTTEENNLPSKEAMKLPGYANFYIGGGGVVRNTLRDPNTGKEIFSGAELCDLAVMPVHQRKGYATLLTSLRLDWLKEQGHTEAFFPDCDEPEPVIGLFEKLQQEGKIKFEKIHEIANSRGTPKSVYKVSKF